MTAVTNNLQQVSHDERGGFMLIHPASIPDIDTPASKKQFSFPISSCADYSAENRWCGLLPFYPFERLEKEVTIHRVFEGIAASIHCISSNTPGVLLAGLKLCGKKRYSPDW